MPHQASMSQTWKAQRAREPRSRLLRSRSRAIGTLIACSRLSSRLAPMPEKALPRLGVPLAPRQLLRRGTSLKLQHFEHKKLAFRAPMAPRSRTNPSRERQGVKAGLGSPRKKMKPGASPFGTRQWEAIDIEKLWTRLRRCKKHLRARQQRHPEPDRGPRRR